MSNDKFDDYVASRMPVHVAAIRARLAAGDASVTADIEGSLGVLLFDSAAWADLIQSTARGQNAFAAVMERAIETAAEMLAIKDAEQAEIDRITSRVELHAGIREWHRAAA